MMDHFDYTNTAYVKRLNSLEGIQFDGRAFALYDPNFKIHNTLIVNFQIQTFIQDGLILWIGDPSTDSSFTIEIQNRQLIARAVANGQPFSVRTDFVKNRLCDGIWHCVQVRLDGSLLTMKVDKKQYTKTEPRINFIDMHGPLFIAGYSERYSPPYLSVRTKTFFHGSLRNLRINDQQVDWLAPRSSGLSAATPEFHRYSTTKTTSNNVTGFSNSPATIQRKIETTTYRTSSGVKDRKFP